MTLDILVNNWKKGKLVYAVAAFYALGCASGTASSGDENQGGSTVSTPDEGGAAGFAGSGGNGGSEEVCLPNNSLICHEDGVYWQDSCGTLGQLKEDCSNKQVCGNGQCVYDCSMATPTSSCSEQNCAFYDTFDYGTCKWDIKTGAPYTSNEKLHLEGNSIVEAKGGPFSLSPACNGDFVAQYKVELLPSAQGTVKISHRNQNPNFSGITVTHYPFSENNKIGLNCNGYETEIGDYDLHLQKKLTVKKFGNRLELFVDDVYITKVACNETTDPTPANAMIMAAGSAVLPQEMKIDDVSLYCLN